MILRLILDSIYFEKITLNKHTTAGTKLIIVAKHLLSTFYKAGVGASTLNFTHTISFIFRFKNSHTVK